MTDAVVRRLVRGISANAVGSVITTAIQLVTVPILLSQWGTELYGSWLILYSLPALLAMSDWGFENAAGNAMTAAFATRDETRALNLFRTYWVVATGISVFLVVAALIAASLIHPTLSSVSITTARIVSGVLVVHVGVMLQAGLMRAVFRAIGRYAEGVMHQNIARVTDAASVVAAALSGHGLIAAGVLMLTSRVVITVGSGVLLSRHVPWLRPGFEGVTVESVRPELKPLLAMMAFPFGFAVSLQGMVAAVGLILGPVVVVTFATLRTLSRFVFQLGGVISNAMLPEAAFAFSNGDARLARAIHRRGCQAVLWLTALLSGSVMLVGDWLLRVWTRGAVAPDHVVLYTLLLIACLDALWTASSVIAIGAGRYERIAVAYVATTVFSLVLALSTLRVAGLFAAPFALLAGTLVMLPFVITTSLRLTGEDARQFLSAIIKIPIGALISHMRRRHVTEPAHT